MTIKATLLSMQDLKYKEFNDKLLADYEKPSIGIRLPALRLYAKQIIHTKTLDELLKEIDNQYVEEIMLKGILIGLDKNLSLETLRFHIENHVKKITNWAECDVFCSSLKITKKYKKEMWQFIQELKNSSYPFAIRFALVMMLSYYMQEEYLEQIFATIVSTHHEHYYVKMANAWLISYCFVHFFAQTSQFMLENSDKIDSWTYQKGLQKSLESNRITTEEKEKIKKMRKLNSFL